MFEKLVPSRNKISLVELSCPWDTDVNKAEEDKFSKYTDCWILLSNQGWNCGLYIQQELSVSDTKD
jgi:hypothetical protein